MAVVGTLDHDRLDVYRLAIQYTAEAFSVAKELSGVHRHGRDQWLDVLGASDGIDVASSCEMKLKLKRIVSMLTRMVMNADGVAELPGGMMRTSITSTSTASLSTSTTGAQNHGLQRSGRVNRCDNGKLSAPAR